MLSPHYRQLIVDKQTEMENINRAANKKRGRRLSGRKLLFFAFYMSVIFGSAIYNASNDDNKNDNLTPILNSIDSARDHIQKLKIQPSKPNDTITYYGHDAIPPQEELQHADSVAKSRGTPKHK